MPKVDYNEKGLRIQKIIKQSFVLFIKNTNFKNLSEKDPYSFQRENKFFC